MRPKVIIWDFDGTLVSSLAGIASSMQETLATYGFSTPSLEDVRRTIGLTLEQSIRCLTHEMCPENLVPALVQHYRSLHGSNAAPLTTMFEGATEVLREARRREIESILVSNKGRDGLHQLLEQLEIGGMFREVFSADDVAYRKPDPRLFANEIAMKLENHSTGNILVVGDTETDLNFAKASGLRSCWAKYGYGDQNSCSGLGPDFVIESIGALWTALEPQLGNSA
ncbi:MAG: HAD family hydrolase [Acidobacteriota bacterium]